MSLHAAQDFSIDPALVGGAPEVGLTRVDLFFAGAPSATANKSGIQYPGVTVFVVPTANSVPDVSQLGSAPHARVEYTDVLTSTDASLPTTFKFGRPIQVTTGVTWAVVVAFDGGEDFRLWRDVVGDPIVGTSVASAGPQGSGVGRLYLATGGVPVLGPLQADPLGVVTGNTTGTSVSTVTAASAWNPVTGEWLKFSVFAARYAVGGNSSASALTGNALAAAFLTTPPGSSINVVSGELEMVLPALRYEYVTYDRATSSATGVSVGERLYQNTVFYPGGTATPATVSVVANQATITAVSGNVNWNTLAGVGGKDPVYVVVTSRDASGPGADVVAVRQVTSVTSNTVAVVDVPFPFSNAGAYFFLSPVAVFEQAVPDARVFQTRHDLLVASRSTANSSVRFVGDSVTALTIVAGGAGYSNTDRISVGGFESVAGVVLGNYAAAANLVTNSVGGIVTTYMANLGCGFVNSALVVVSVANSTGGASAGSGANLAPTIGSLVKAELLGRTGGGGYFQGCRPRVIEVGDSTPGVGATQPAGTFVTMQHRLPYYVVPYANAAAGVAYFCDVDGAWDQFPVSTGVVEHAWQLAKRRVLPSWSRELWIPYANGTSCNGAGGSTANGSLGLTSNSSVLLVNAVSNSDFSHVQVSPDSTTITFSRYIINNDATGENTNQGNAWARGIETKFTLASGSLAEDVIVYATAYRPPGTDVLAYARLMSAGQDPDAFDDKDWTLLTITAGDGVFSTQGDLTDYREYSFGLRPYANTGGQLPGYATTTLSSAVLTGSGTTWNSSVAAGDLVVVSPSLFPNTYVVARVATVTNGTSVTLSRPISNNDLVGPGMTVQRVAFPLQAFRNKLNDNVARYYTLGGAEVDRFDVIAVKIVLLANSSINVPCLTDVRCTAVSA